LTPTTREVLFQDALSFKDRLVKEHTHNGRTITVSDETELLLDAIAELVALEKTRPKGLFEPRIDLGKWLSRVFHKSTV